MPRLGGLLVRFAVLFAFWLLLVDTLKIAELAAGAVAAGLGALAAVAVSSGGGPALRPRGAWLLRLPAALARLPLDTGVVALALWRAILRRRPMHGSFRAIRFRSGGRDGRSLARRVAAKWLDSLGPNSYVIGIDDEQDVMLVHQLDPPADPASADPMELR
jgi:multisubunit Na+/H+ antiporter MnhE subunit